jgi:hypothetical protein
MGGVGMSSPSDLAEAQRQAARVAAKSDIRDVRLMKSCAEVTDLPAADATLTYDLNSGANVEYEPGGEAFVVRSNYCLSIMPAVTADAAPAANVIARIEFEQAALFVISLGEGDNPPTADELSAYAVTTGQFALHPYAREYIYDLTGRLGLPPLTVGVLTMPYDDAPAPRRARKRAPRERG